MTEMAMLAGAFICGAVTGFLVLLRIGTVQEGTRLRPRPPGRAAAATRRLTGLYIQGPGSPCKGAGPSR
jgi:hypothetical protein